MNPIPTMTHGHKLVSVRPESGYRLQLSYADGMSCTVDLRNLISRGGVLAALNDPQVFAQATVEHLGMAVAFPGDIELCADSLRYDALCQQAGIDPSAIDEKSA